MADHIFESILHENLFEIVMTGFDCLFNHKLLYNIMI